MFLIIILIASALVWGLPANTAALTAEEIQHLLHNGISEATIQMMLESEQRARSLNAAAKDRRLGVKTIVRPDGRKAIVYSTARDDPSGRQAEERLKEERAWEMLRQLIIDTRTAGD